MIKGQISSPAVLGPSLQAPRTRTPADWTLLAPLSFTLIKAVVVFNLPTVVEGHSLLPVFVSGAFPTLTSGPGPLVESFVGWNPSVKTNLCSTTLLELLRSLKLTASNRNQDLLCRELNSTEKADLTW